MAQQTGTTHYYAMLRFQDKGQAINDGCLQWMGSRAFLPAKQSRPWTLNRPLSYESYIEF